MHRIRDTAARHRAQQVGGQVRRRLVRPPGHHRRVRHQQWNHQRIRVMHQTAERTQHDDLARAGVGAEPHFRVEERVRLTVIGIRASILRLNSGRWRSPGRGARGWRCSPLRDHAPATASFVEISSVSTRPKAASPRSSCSSSIFAEISRVSVFLHGNDHGILQRCPSRASISTASCGPHVPERYGCGWPSVDQNSSIGSRICHAQLHLARWSGTAAGRPAARRESGVRRLPGTIR